MSPWRTPLLLAVSALLAVAGCRRPDTAPAATASAPKPTSAQCAACHQDVHRAWSDSDHALAHRLPDPARDRDLLAPQAFALHGVDYRTGAEAGEPRLSEQRPGRDAQTFRGEFILGRRPLVQLVVPTEKGRYQMSELAFDPVRKDWFNVFADEKRQPGEWGHWLSRGMNWNSMCAHCHLTEFRKNYDPGADAYRSTWREHGIGCFQCHGEMPATHGQPGAPKASPADPVAARRQAQETCAACHARVELLVGHVEPKGAFHDHYRLTLPTDATTFHPDGQMKDEVFNYTSFLTSRMGGKAGVTCLDCHDAHSAQTKLPVENNALCLQCHAAPGPTKAPVIEPISHSRHAAGSKGTQCVGCHMPTTPYMQRDPRHDHGFLKPDPLMTKELGIPNACDRCHGDKGTDWTLQHAEAWYGPKLAASAQRARARVVAAVQAGAADAPGRLAGLLDQEDVPAWRATLLQLARPLAGREPRLLEHARAGLKDEDPLVRSAAVQVLGAEPATRPAVAGALQDPSRLVRLDAAWLLSDRLSPAQRPELDAYLAVSADQPGGRARQAQDFFNRNLLSDAEAAARRAAQWDPNSADIHETLGLILDAAGKPAEAAAALWRTAQGRPADGAAAFNAALAFAGAGRLADAELALREAIRRAPTLDRAWYNLGLLLAQTQRPTEALTALARAETLAPRVPDYPYARATILLRQGDQPGARAAAEKALQADPTHLPSRQLLQAR